MPTSSTTTGRRLRRKSDDPDPYLSGMFAVIAELVSAAGANGRPAALARLLEMSGGYQTTVFAAFQKNAKPVRLFSNLPADEEPKTLKPYFDGTYLLDPWYNMATSEMEDGVYRLSECVPDDFKKSAYYLDYYAATGLVDECGIFVRLSEQVNVVGMLGIRSNDRSPRKRGRLGDLKAMFPAVREIVHNHWSGLSTTSPESMENLQSLCRARGLAGREIEVTAHLLRGYSNKVIGRELGISHETVKVYRKRINRKLGTRSTREIYAMFFRKAF